MCWGIGGLLGAIEKQYMRCCPYGTERLRKLSYKTAWATVCVAVAAGMGVFFWNLYVEHRVSSYCFMSIALAVYVVCIEVPEWYIRRVEERVRSYVASETNHRYLKMFLVQAYEASEQGDMRTLYSESLFSENIEYLRMEVMQEIYRRRRRAHELSGYTFVTLTPVFMMSVLRKWGTDFTAELESFYAGAGNSIEWSRWLERD